MLVYVDVKNAVSKGVRFYKSTNNVTLTPNMVPPASFFGSENPNTGKRYNASGELRRAPTSKIL